MPGSQQRPAPSADAAVSPLVGQWFEAVDVGHRDRARVVFSLGWVLDGHLRAGGRAPIERDDARLVGAPVARATVRGDGSLHLTSGPTRWRAQEDWRISPPWRLAGLRGRTVEVSADGRITLRAEDERMRLVDDERLAAWAAAEPSELERELLWCAEDDWLTPADAISALVRNGMTDRHEIAREGMHLLARLTARGDLRAGWIGEHGFEPTSETTAEVVERLLTTWRALAPRFVAPGQIAWFDLTPTGAQRSAPR